MRTYQRKKETIFHFMINFFYNYIVRCTVLYQALAYLNDIIMRSGKCNTLKYSVCHFILAIYKFSIIISWYWCHERFFETLTYSLVPRERQIFRSGRLYYRLILITYVTLLQSEIVVEFNGAPDPLVPTEHHQTSKVVLKKWLRIRSKNRTPGGRVFHSAAKPLARDWVFDR